jgi:glycosyltransferase involved in cell wall biosynthesis
MMGEKAITSRAPAGTDGPRVLLLGPARTALSGVSTHLSMLFESVSRDFCLSQFQVGSEGRTEGRTRMLLRLASSPFALVACLLRSRPRIVHINTAFDPKGYWRDIVYLALAKALRRKVVYQIHGGALPGEFFARSRALAALLRHVLSWPDAVVVLGRSEMAAHREFVPRARLVRIANAVPLCAADLRAERYTANRPLAIAYLGRLAADKGILETIEAVRILRDRSINACLTIAGAGPALGEIRRAIATNGLGDRTRLAGAVTGAAKQLLWQRTDVFALPTYHREGLPYALLEAMICGAVPVISPVGAIPDVVQHEVHGLFVPARDSSALADALERLATDRALLHRLALAARARIVSEYSVARLAREFTVLYRSLV